MVSQLSISIRLPIHRLIPKWSVCHRNKLQMIHAGGLTGKEVGITNETYSNIFGRRCNTNGCIEITIKEIKMRLFRGKHSGIVTT